MTCVIITAMIFQTTLLLPKSVISNESAHKCARRSNGQSGNPDDLMGWNTKIALDQSIIVYLNHNHTRILLHFGWLFCMFMLYSSPLEQVANTRIITVSRWPRSMFKPAILTMWAAGFFWILSKLQCHVYHP